MFPETLYPKTRTVLEKIQHLEILQNFYLAGGTALALQLGHRKSVDLDFFTSQFLSPDVLIQSLKAFSPTISQQTEGTLDVIIDDVKVSFFHYDYPLLQPLHNFLQITVADVIDIACMKITAISSRGSKKDFVDLHIILENVTLEKLFKKFEEKYRGVSYNRMHILKSLIYFETANNDPEPDYLKPIKWEKVKEDLQNYVLFYIKHHIQISDE